MEEIINSVMQSPENTNPNVLRSQLKAIQGEGSGGPGYSVEKSRTTLFDADVTTIGDRDSGMFYGTISEYITTPTIIVTFGDDEYILEQQTRVGGSAMGYGEFGDEGPLFTNIPFAVISNTNNHQTRLYTESSGRYLIKIEGIETVVTPTDEFKEAVNASVEGGGGNNAFLITPQPDPNDPNVAVSDKTFSEITAAIETGKNLFLNLPTAGVMALSVSANEESAIYLYAFQFEPPYNSATMLGLVISRDNRLRMTPKTITTS